VKITGKLSILDSFQLKIIAMLLMVTDHIGAILFPEYRLLRVIGRLAFPIFAFLLVVGFHHTRDVWKYLLRLAIFAVVTEVIFDMAFFGKVLDFSHQNVFFTLALGILMLILFEKSFGWPVKLTTAVICMLAADLIRCDYSSGGLILILCIHLAYKRSVWLRALSVVAGNMVIALPALGIQLYGCLAAVPIALYNGREGRKMKYFFYVFYPLHLLILFILKKLI